MMSNKVLIVYGTYAGSTAEVAQAIGRSLERQGFAVDIKPVADRPHLEEYQAVVVGSAVQYARWLPQSIAYVEENRAALNRLPVALFCVHIQNLGDDETSRQNRQAYLDEVRPLVRPFAEGYFAGKFDRRGAYLLLPKWLARFIPPIDLRKWSKIDAWSQRIGGQLDQELQWRATQRSVAPVSAA
jgi:menaquinone-dependent protoporphyrinogen oxidase